jgi:hypothetical protein
MILFAAGAGYIKFDLLIGPLIIYTGPLRSTSQFFAVGHISSVVLCSPTNHSGSITRKYQLIKIRRFERWRYCSKLRFLAGICVEE